MLFVRSLSPILFEPLIETYNWQAGWCLGILPTEQRLFCLSFSSGQPNLNLCQNPFRVTSMFWLRDSRRDIHALSVSDILLGTSLCNVLCIQHATCKFWSVELSLLWIAYQCISKSQFSKIEILVDEILLVGIFGSTKSARYLPVYAQWHAKVVTSNAQIWTYM